MKEQLPFGRTEVAEKDLLETIDTDTAISHLVENGVSNPEPKVQTFIECLPDLLAWLETNGREYPWRQTTDPWEVYVAEILLQRTRGDAVDGIYREFLEQFPTPEAVYEAPEADIRDMVHSLGFVNHRIRTLQEVGELIVTEHGGEVPDSLTELKRPWRVGDYSARACQLFARGDPRALVDSNFARVIGRALSYEMPSQPHKSDSVYNLMEALTPDDPALARAFNLAVLDLGAMVCTASDPECDVCPLQSGCVYADEQGFE